MIKMNGVTTLWLLLLLCKAKAEMGIGVDGGYTDVLVRVEEDFEDCDQSDLGSVTREEAGNGHCCHDKPDTSVLSD